MELNLLDSLMAWAVQVMGLAGSPPPVATRLSKGGSDRTFYRLCWDGGHVMAMHYRHERRENAYYVPIGRFLREIGIAVPEIYHHDAGQGFLLMEDLGDDDLWSHRSAPWDIRQGLYQKTLTTIHRLHVYPTETFPRAAVPLMEGFDAGLYRWEREYFREHFVAGVCGIRMGRAEEQALEKELNSLALRLDAGRPALVHRDFQSQNVMICRDEPVLIDFQGMRLGNPLYDLGSLLYDPYVSMNKEEREELLACYFRLSDFGLSWSAFQNQFREASAQRLMQALGAYGFLGLKKGRPDFLRHVVKGVAHLEEVTKQAPGLPLLRGLAARCRKIAGEEVQDRLVLINYHDSD